MRIHVRELISFFDEAEEARPHANAIKSLGGEELGLALLVRYFQSTGASAALLPDSCTQGTRKGVRLDGWVRVERANAATDYQVEVKTWSFSSLGGRALPVDCSVAELRAFKMERWEKYWDTSGFVDRKLDKVLTPMRRLPDARRVLPLACLWDAMHPTGLDAPFFVVPLKGRKFPEVSVFSVSSYLRRQGEPTIELPLPLTEERLKWLERLFG